MALTFGLFLAPAVTPAAVAGAACVRISGGNFDAPGNDNYAENLNGEYVKIKNYCSTTKSVGGWKLHDDGRKHTYTFASGFGIKAGATVTVYTGRGTNTAARRYWGRSYGAIWNNDGDTAYLRNGAGTLQNKWYQ
jgi:hypothetical protein